MKITSTPSQDNNKTAVPPGLIIYNVPLNYTKKEIKGILFSPKEIELIESMKLYKFRQSKKTEKTLKVEIIFQNWDICNDMYDKLDNLEFDEEHTLKVKRFNPERKLISKESSLVSDSKSNISMSKKEKGKKKRAVVGANITSKNGEQVDEIANNNNNTSISKEDTKKPDNMKKRNTPIEKTKDTLFVRNLDYSFTDTKLLAEFFKVEPENVIIPLRKCLDLHTDQFFNLENMNRGFAIIKFDDCLNIDGKFTEYKNCMFQGRKLKVQVAFKRGYKTQSTLILRE